MSNKNIIERIKSALDKVRPSLQMDGGDVEFVSFDEKTGLVGVQLKGMCHGCPMAQITLKQGIEETLRKEVAEVKEVQQV